MKRRRSPKVQHLRLINGDELIGIVVKSDTKSVTVDQPLVVTYQSGKNDNREYVALVKYLPYSLDNFCKIQKDHVIAVSDLHPDIERYYELSLLATQKYQDSTLDYIRYANQMMEQRLFNAIMMDSDKIGHITQSSNTVN